ncbi:phospholipid phosphatase 1-like [Cimex lectularius]|uniref:Phosphatidic acid phosphatase type 2/haloperoxidase domain-containing protein n=1 Tax=Cimex lectularius TaxID=79782 RepID=A0A8I6S1X8_CIMLE|nr:phospholipid phosphatase 1-like [Cimex lectularius]
MEILTSVQIFTDLFSVLSAMVFACSYPLVATINFRGFSCEDSSIRYPTVEDSLSESNLAISLYLIPFLIFISCETALFPWSKPNVPRFLYLVTLYQIVLPLLLGIFALKGLVAVLKTSVGRLGPTFVEACQPDINCTLPEYHFRYITNYTCVRNGTKLEELSRQSFPSGISADAAQMVVLVALFIEAKVEWSGINLVKRLMQLVVLCFGLDVCLTRVSEYREHWSDVMTGILMGVVFAFFTAFYLLNWFKSSSPREISDESIASAGSIES